MRAEVWAVIVADTGQLVGAWEDCYEAKGAAQAYEEEQKVDCLIVEGTLTYESVPEGPFPI